MNNDLVRICKETVVEQSELLSRHKEMTGSFDQYSRFPGQDLNLEPTEYEPEFLITCQRCLLSCT